MLGKKICMLMDGNFIEHNGDFYSPHMNYEAFLSRFSDSFSSIEVVARAFHKEVLPDGINKVCESNTQFTPLASSRGALGFLKSLKENISIITKSIKRNDLILIRFPGNLAILTVVICFFMRREYSIELVAEPKDYFSKHSSKSPFRSIFRFIHTSFTKHAVKNSKVVRYVTNEYLQNNYPTRGISFGFSDVYLPVLPVLNNLSGVDLQFDFVNVAMMHNHSKGHLLLIDAISELAKENISVRVCLIGDGHYKKEFQEYVNKLGLSDSIIFSGAITDRSYFYEILTAAKFFVLPSFQEGMPRALLEAINSGLTVISSDVGGIPEVLSKSAMFNSGDLEGFVRILKRCIYEQDFVKEINSHQQIEIVNFRDDNIRELTKEYCKVLKAEYK